MRKLLHTQVALDSLYQKKDIIAYITDINNSR